jgi:DNA recombination protein RmuC
MAEDMLRAAGFIEGINYEKQDTITGGGRPDYTFLMPPDRVLYMDVKFPLDSYAKYVGATEPTSRDSIEARVS